MATKTNIPENAAKPGDFKKKKNRNGTMLELPSGIWVKAKPVELTQFIRSGNIPNALMKIINDALQAGDVGEETGIINTKDLDVDSVREMYQMIDDILYGILKDPKVHPIPVNDQGEPDEELKDDDLLYIDEIEDQDKLYLFNWSTGTVKDLESFREKSSERMATVQEGDSSKQPAKRASRTTKK